jgi:hypothetical protein
MGVQVKIGEGEYQRVPWGNFSQEDIRKFAQDKKMEAFVEPFIEISQEEKIKQTEVNVKPQPKLERPPKQSLIAAFFGSGIGLFIIFVIYAANIYAGYEVAIFRAQPPLLVAGLSAIPALGFLAPIVFLAMPTRLKPEEDALAVAAGPDAAAQPVGAATTPAEDAVNPMLDDKATHPAGLKLAHSESPADKPSHPEPVSYQRGQFTFNRRFIETKFANFFGVVRRDADKDMVLVVKSARGEYIGQRISRIAPNDFHLQVQKGHASEEVMIPFQEIKEIILRHKDAK